MEPFETVLKETQRDCVWEQIPDGRLLVLAGLCGPAEIALLIDRMDALDDADLVDDVGDIGDEYWRLRIAYSRTLALVGEPAIEPLLQALGSGNSKTRAYAAKALGQIGTPRAFAPIVALLAQEADFSIRLSLIEALGELSDERAIPLLLPYLKTGKRLNRGWTIRIAALALGRLGTEAVIRPLAKVLASDSDWFARLGAAEGLGEMRHPLAADALRAALADADPCVAKKAAVGLQETDAPIL